MSQDFDDIEDQDAHDREIHRRYYGGDDECDHEDDGEGTCLGCGAWLRTAGANK